MDEVLVTYDCLICNTIPCCEWLRFMPYSMQSRLWEPLVENP
ncbi:hypothetical protein LINGRAHAP2_LOCUS31640, partial [Linum grandiflorum]